MYINRNYIQKYILFAPLKANISFKFSKQISTTANDKQPVTSYLRLVAIMTYLAWFSR